MSTPSRRNFIKGIGFLTAGISLPSIAFGSNASSFASLESDLNANGFVPLSTESPLIQAILKGDISKVTQLLNSDPGLITIRDSWDRSTYSLACIYGFKEITKLLSERGYRKDIFDFSAEGNLQEIRKSYQENPGSFNARLRSGIAPLHIACQAGQREAVETLTGIGADKELSTYVPENFTPLYFAINHAEEPVANAMATAMLANGANPNALQKDDTSLLHAAAEKNNSYIAAMLIRKGGDVRKKNKSGQTAADIAKGREYKAVAKILDESDKIRKDVYITRYRFDDKGNPIKREDNYEIPQTWINDFVTFAHFNLEKIKSMYKLCPDLLLTRAVWDEIAVEGPAHLGNTANTEFLLEKGSPLSICTAIAMNYTDNVKNLLAENPSFVYERGPHDFPVILYTAFGKEKTDMAGLLIKNGADVNGNVRGRSALHEAAVRGYVTLCELLLINGADPNMQGTSSFMPGTPLKVVTTMNRGVNKEKVIELLKKYGAKELQWKVDYN